jgi:SAM-dependent methyltransferase
VKHPQETTGVTAFVPERHGWRVIWGEALANAFDFSRFRLIVDLGGATGGVLEGLIAKHPHLRGIVVELPYSKVSAEAALKASGASKRVSFAACDFFKDPYPAGADLFFMSHIIHDWDDEHCLKLLKRCYKALPVGGVAIVQEFLLNEEKTGSFLAVFQWVGLLPGTSGNQRTGKEIMALMKRAGFSDTETRPIDGEQSIVIGWKR